MQRLACPHAERAWSFFSSNEDDGEASSPTPDLSSDGDSDYEPGSKHARLGSTAGGGPSRPRGLAAASGAPEAPAALGADSGVSRSVHLLGWPLLAGVHLGVCLVYWIGMPQ